MTVQYCSQCGNSLQPGVNFCPQCGVKISESKDKQDKLASVTKNRISSLKLSFIIIGIVCAVTIIALYIVTHFQNQLGILPPAPVLSSHYEDNHFFINYPKEWVATQPKANAVLISGKKDTPAFYSFVTIEVVPSKKLGGKYSSLNDAVENLRKQTFAATTEVSILDEGNAILPPNLNQFHGKYYIATFTYKGIPLKNIQFIITNNNESELYSWGYTSAINQYEHDLPIAKAMFETWIIK